MAGTYLVRNTAAVTKELEADTPLIVAELQQGERVAVRSVQRTAAGQFRAETAQGWVSLVAGNGTVLLEELGGGGEPPALNWPAQPHQVAFAERDLPAQLAASGLPAWLAAHGLGQPHWPARLADALLSVKLC